MDADITATGGFYFTAHEELNRTSDEIISVTSMTGRQCCHDYFNSDSFYMTTVWGKLFRRHLYEGIRFPLNRVHEDEARMPMLLYRADKVTVVRSWLYWYRQREGSIMNSGFSEKRFDSIAMFNELIQFFADRNERELVKAVRTYRDRYWVRLIIQAREEFCVDQIPAEFRMPLWKAYCITLVDTLRRGGVKFVLKRLGNLAEKIRERR